MGFFNGKGNSFLLLSCWALFEQGLEMFALQSSTLFFSQKREKGKYISSHQNAGLHFTTLTEEKLSSARLIIHKCHSSPYETLLLLKKIEINFCNLHVGTFLLF